MAFNREKTLHNAQRQAQKGNVDKAIKEYEKVLDEDPGDIRSKLKMADLLVKADRFDEALSAYQEVAYGYANDDLYEKAAAVYKQALRIAPEDPVIHTQLGEAYHRLGRLKDAIRVFHRAQKIYKKNGDETSQRTVLESMVRIDPEDIGLRIQLAERYEKDKLHDEALQLFNEAAAQLKEEGRLDEFVQVAERVIYLRPDYIDMRKEVVRIYLGRGDEKHALKHLQYCFKVTPQDIETLELLGSTFHRLGADQKSLLVYGELAALYERMGEHDRAGSAYRTMLNIDPSHAQARAFLGQGGPQTQQQRGTEPAYEVADEESEGDALDGIEFLDEEDEADVYVIEDPEPVDEGNEFMEFAQDAIAELDPEIDNIEEYPEVEVVPAAPVDPEDELTQILTESEVFLKYGLLDRAEEVITRVIRTAPDHIEGREQMRQLLEKQGNKHGAAHQLVELARITSDNPNRAAGYLQQAVQLVDPGVVEMLCDGAGVDPSLLSGIEGIDTAFIDEVSEGLEEISGMELEVGEPVGAHTLDIDPDMYAEEEEPDDGEPGVYDLDESLFLDPDDEFDEFDALDEATDASLQEESIPSAPPDIVMEPTDATQEDLDVASMNFGATVPDIEAPAEAGLDVPTDASMDQGDIEAMDIDDDVEEMSLDDVEEMELGDIEEMDFDDVEEMDFGDVEGMDFGDVEEMDIDDIEIAVDDDLEVDLDDELALDGADVVDINVDDMNFDENALAALDDSAKEGDFDINFSDEDADMMFDELFGGGMFDDAEDDNGAGSLAFDTEGSEVQVAETAGPNGSFGARSLSKKFDASVQDVELNTGSINNSSLELGKTYKDMGLFAEAIEEFEHAMEDPDAAPAALYNIALCYIELGETEDAADNLTKLSQDESAPNGWRMMAHEKLEKLHP